MVLMSVVVVGISRSIDFGCQMRLLQVVSVVVRTCWLRRGYGYSFQFRPT